MNNAIYLFTIKVSHLTKSRLFAVYKPLFLLLTLAIMPLSKAISLQQPKQQLRHLKFGLASIYDKHLEGHLMANGKVFHIKGNTVASLLFPIGAKLKITNLHNHQVVYGTNTDKMSPNMLKQGRIVDLSPHLAQKLGFHDGLAKVAVERTKNNHYKHKKFYRKAIHERKHNI